MKPRLVTPPTEEPVTLDQLKVHIKVDSTSEDDELRGLISAARGLAEAHQKRQIVNQTWRLSLDCFPRSAIYS